METECSHKEDCESWISHMFRRCLKREQLRAQWHVKWAVSVSDLSQDFSMTFVFSVTLLTLRYSTLRVFGAQCTTRSGQHVCLLFWRSWVRLAFEGLFCWHISHFFLNSGIFRVKADVCFHQHIAKINETFPLSTLCTEEYCNWDIVMKSFKGT
jgi:hypothetical protein